LFACRWLHQLGVSRPRKPNGLTTSDDYPVSFSVARCARPRPGSLPCTRNPCPFRTAPAAGRRCGTASVTSWYVLQDLFLGPAFSWNLSIILKVRNMFTKISRGHQIYSQEYLFKWRKFLVHIKKLISGSPKLLKLATVRSNNYLFLTFKKVCACRLEKRNKGSGSPKFYTFPLYCNKVFQSKECLLFSKSVFCKELK